MTIRHKTIARLTPLTALLLWLQPAAMPQKAPLHILVSNGVRAVMEALQPDLEKAAGRPLAFDFGSTTGLRQKIDQGQAFDLLILTSDAVADLAKSGKVAGPPTELARCGIGLGVRAGAAKPDIHDADALKQTLRRVKSMTWAQDGASRPHIEKMLTQMGLAEEAKPKEHPVTGSVAANASVASGQSEVVLTLVSEILPAPGVSLVGKLPDQYQGYIHFSVAPSAHADPAAAKAVIAVLTGQAAKPVYRAKGMEPKS